VAKVIPFGRAPKKPLAVAVAVALVPLGAHAQAGPATLPAGGTVTAGSATLTYSPNKLQIDQSTQKAIVQWDSFSIGSSAWVNFTQPSSSAIALNRVAGNNPSEIFGRLTANGQVFLTNPNGVLFAPSASVDVGALFATTLSIADKDFLAGRYNFYDAGGAGSVINQGSIVTANGYAALAGPQVRNDGIIVARAGTVALAAGSRVTLDMVGDGLIRVSVDEAALNASAINSGTIQADGGNVILTARSANALLDTVVNNSGVIRANSLVERNGEIILDGGSAGVVSNSGTLQAAGADAGTTGGLIKVQGDKVAAVGNAVIDASGDSGGGSITIGRGASATFIGASTTIRADATREGSGGWVETSGSHLEINSAPQVGAGGTWLIDPYNIEVVAGTGTVNNTGPTTFTPNGDDSQIGATLIENQLNAGTNVIVDTGQLGSAGTQAGDITISAAINKSVANTSSLTFNAFHDVAVNQNITMASGAITFNANRVTNNGAISTTGANTILSADAFNLSAGTINGGTGAVILRPRTGTKSFGIESAAEVTVGNADIASISTSDFVVFGSGLGTTFTGNMTIGANAQVNGGSKHLAFFRSTVPGGTTTVGPNGVTTSGNVIVSGGGGSLLGSGTVAGNQVQLRASTGIGSAVARVGTAANTLAINTGGSGAFVAEADAVTLGNVNLTVGGNVNNVSNFVGGGGTYDETANGPVTVAGPVTSTGTMNLGVAGALSVVGNAGLAASLSSTGGQTITASSLDVRSNGANATITNSGGNQNITINGGGSDTGLDVRTLASVGTAVINNTAPTGVQQINVTGDHISLNAGFGNAAILASGSQTISVTGTGPGSGNISIANSTVNFTNSFAGIQAPTQTISASGNVTLTANLAGGTSQGVRIGGLAGTGATATNLNLGAGGDVVLTGGSGLVNGAALGSSVVTSFTNNITVNAGGNVILNSGPDGGARIGYALGLPAGGDIAITAAGIQLNGTTQPTSIRTTGNVNLQAGSISEASNGFIVANALTVAAPGAVALGGANQVATFNNASSDLTLNNTGTLTVTGSTAANATLTNAGAVTISGFWNSLGATSITTTGSAADLTVANNVSATGSMNLNLSGALNVSGAAATSAFLTSTGSQTINAGSLAVTSRDGRTAAINQTGPGGSQTITVTGGAIDIEVSSGVGGTAGVSSAGNQNLSLVNGDHINVNGAFGGATLQSFGAAQTISATGTGRNAITVGSTGARGRSSVGAFNESVTAGLAGESGSITIVGPAVSSALAGFVTNPVAGGTQTISTSGQISITGGSALSQLSNFGTGIFHNGSGIQTINAAGISIAGGTAGNTNAAFISSIGGGVVANAGNQIINVVGGNIAVTAGSVGSGNRAGLTSSANQTINGNPNIVVTGGADGGGSGLTNTSNGAFISANTAGKLQTINAANITVNAGAGGIDTSATINAASQVLNATGDVVINGGGGSGTANGARIGGPSGAATNLVLNARNVVLAGGSTTGVGLGSSVVGTPQPNTITVNATGDVILNSGSGAGARIGSSSNGTAGGDIAVNARGNVALNGVANATAIRTTGNVTLNAGGSISEASNGSIAANTLNMKAGSAALTGANAISTLSVPLQSGLPGVAGSLSLNNTGALTITQLRAGGVVNLTNAGTVALNASGTQDARISSVGGQTISADALILHAQDGRVANINNVSGNQNVSTGAGGIDLSVTNGQGVAQIANNRGVVTSGTQTVQTTGALNVVGGSTTIGSVNSGIFQMQTGKQTVSAASIALQAANAPVNTAGAFILNTSTGNLPGGDQEINVAGGTIAITAGGTGLTNRAGIATNGNQTINGNPDIVVTGGSSGTGTNGANNTAFISGSSIAGKVQTINANNITLNAGSGGTDTSATITAAKQVIVAGGDVKLNGGANAGDSNGARIGGSGGNSSTATDLTLSARDVILTAGTTASGAALGSSGNTATPLDNNIIVNASRDVILNASATNGVRIGTNSDFATPAGGNISVVAGRDIQLNGDVHAAAIRTTGNVSLSAGGAVGETSRGFVLANGLTTVSGGATLLGGPNQISAFNATSGGDVLLNNSGVLNVTGMSAAGDATLNNIGDVTVSGPWNVTGTSTINVGSDLSINAAMTSASVMLNATTGNITEDPLTGAIIANTLTTSSAGTTSLTGANQVGAFSGSSFGDLAFTNTSPLLSMPVVSTHGGTFSLVQNGDLSATHSESFDALNVTATGSMYVLGGSADGASTALSSTRPMSISVGKDLRITGGSGTDAFALLKGYSDISLTIGGALRIDAGTGSGAYARLQTATRDSSISIFFANLASGGYFVNGVEGALRRGQSGIFSGSGTADLGETLFITYGQ
jgi:filamentous hemagglutinin family protein